MCMNLVVLREATPYFVCTLKHYKTKPIYAYNYLLVRYLSI